jgi:hypothetical protein
MVDLKDGQSVILGTHRGLLKLTSAFDRPTSSWRLLNTSGEVVFKLADDGRLVPLGAAGDGKVYSLCDLHEWGSLA